MAKLNHLFPFGISGMIGGKLVFRTVRNKIIISAAPSSPKTCTEAQQRQRRLFARAMQYAKAQMADPQNRADYEAAARWRNMPNACNVAVADFFRPPHIGLVNVSQYTGKAGDLIYIQASDDFMVEHVTVIICNEAGQTIEQGEAVMKVNRLDWVYKVIETNLVLAGTTIKVTATDRPGNTCIEIRECAL